MRWVTLPRAMDGAKPKDKPKQDWQLDYRELEKRHRRFMKRYDQVMRERYFYKQQAYDLEAELRTLRPENYQAYQKIDRLQQQIEKLRAERDVLKKQLAGVKETLDVSTRPQPAFVKASVAKTGKKRPGRPPGHEGAFREMPEKIDEHIDAPPHRNSAGLPCCPKCRCPLQKLKQHERIVEDIIPAKALVQCYHTTSGYCPCCGERVESRAPEQPPAADVRHGQIGINALVMAVVLRMVYRMPYEPITQLLADLPQIRVSKGAIARQVQRVAGWLEKEYRRIGISLKLSSSVNMDETSWRVDGQNRWLWTILNEKHTLFHIDKSRGGQVVKKLLGEVYGGTLTTDFYSAYGEIACRKQKCLVHLLRELRDTSAKSKPFAEGPLCRRLKRLIKELILLKKQKPGMEIRRYQARARALEERLKDLAGRTYGEADADRIAKRLRRHEKELTLFLWDDELSADNNAAERALRPAVVMRKITGGSRSERGAKATAILLSLSRTIRQQNLPMIESFKSMLVAAWANQPAGLLTDAPANTS